MEIRKDLKSISEYFEMLESYANTIHRFNTKDWSHLKNQEDFYCVYRLMNEDQIDNGELMNKKMLLKLFREYSEQSDEELTQIVNEYIATRRSRKLIVNSIIPVIIISCITGAIIGIVKYFFEIESNMFSSGISGGFIGGILVAYFSSVLRKDIRGFLESKKDKMI